MNTPRQPNVRTSIDKIHGEFRGPGLYGRTSTSFNTAFMPGPKPVATIIITGTSRPPMADERPPIVSAK
jgi:hypothetical protein